MSDQWVNVGPISILIAEGEDEDEARKYLESVLDVVLMGMKQLGKIKDWA